MPRLIRIEKMPAASAKEGLRTRVLPPESDAAEYLPFTSLIERSLPRGASVTVHRPAGIQGLLLLVEGTCELAEREGGRHLLHAGDALWLGASSADRSMEQKAGPGGEARLLELGIGLQQSDPHGHAATRRLPGEQFAVGGMRGTRVRVIAGHFQGKPGLAPLSVPVTCLDVTMPEAGYLVHGVPAGRRVLVYLQEGTAELEGAVVLAGDLALVACEGNPFRIGSATGARFVLLHGPRG